MCYTTNAPHHVLFQTPSDVCSGCLSVHCICLSSRLRSVCTPPHAGKYLEIFARKNNLRNFWVSIGNEVTGTGLPEEDMQAFQQTSAIPGAVYGRGSVTNNNNASNNNSAAGAAAAAGGS